MQHAKQHRTLGRSQGQRASLLRNLAIELFTNEKIVTTTAKAKELRPFAERLITHAKNSSVSARRTVAGSLGTPKDVVIKKLFEDIAPRYQERAGGYTRIIKMAQTSGRDEAVIELV